MTTTEPIQPRKRPKIDYLDGLRGFSAVMVALFHAQLFAGHGEGISAGMLPIYLKPISGVLAWGHMAVPVFIVLSGYSLTLPVAISEEKKLSGGFVSYIKRRARRILPPYYFALILFIIMIFAIPLLNTPQNTWWDQKIPVDIPSIISHFLLLHNFNADWIFKINGPFWSVAVEWQIYFLFPLLILIWRRFNLITAVLLAGIVGTTIGAFSVIGDNSHSWFLGLFALGMLGANINFSKQASWQKVNAIISSKSLFYLGSLFLAVLFVVAKWKFKTAPFVHETIVGLFTVLLLIYFSHIENNGLKKPLFLKLLNSNLFMFLGLFSYSIYLIHSPFLALTNLLTINIHMSTTCRWFLMELIAVPVAVLLAYLFYLIVERRYQTPLIKPKYH